MDKIDLRGLKYRVIELDIDGETKWVAQHRTRDDKWVDCYDDYGKRVVRDSRSSARHWFMWEDGSRLYPDAGTDGQSVYCFKKDGTRILEADEVKAKEAEAERLKEENELMHRCREKIRSMPETGEKRELFVCDCGDISHQFVANLDTFDDWQHVSVEVKLNRNLPWYKRLWVALKYIFLSAPCRFGDFDEIILARKHAPQLQRVVDALLNIKDEEGGDGED